jgi:hypothetical protein
MAGFVKFAIISLPDTLLKCNKDIITDKAGREKRINCSLSQEIRPLTHPGFSFHETRTMEVLNDIRSMKSEVGILS